MSKEKPTEQTDWKSTKQTDKPWKRPIEKEQQAKPARKTLKGGKIQTPIENRM
jgi:hypothetical protein